MASSAWKSGLPVAGEEVAGRGQRGVVLQPPHGLAPDETAPEVVQRLGDEGAREAGLDVALRTRGERAISTSAAAWARS